MPLNIRTIAVSAAVICFFGVAIIGWAKGLSPFACCNRAVTAAICVYIASGLAVKVINSILINAMITNRINRQKEKDSANRN